MPADRRARDPRVPPTRSRRRGVPVVALALTLALSGGCSWFRDEPPATTTTAACPAALLLAGADRMVAYTPGSERSNAAIRYVAAIDGLESSCRNGPDGVEVELRFAVVVEAGPAFDGSPAVLDLFIATVGPDRRVGGKRRLAVRLQPDPASGRAGQVEELTLRLPLAPGEAPSRRIYVGFQLDRLEMRERLERLG